MDSSLIIRSDSDSEVTNIIQDTSTDIQSQSQSQNQSQTYKDSPYNNSNFKLEEPPNIGIYIFDNGLFIRMLLNIDYTKEREMLIKCSQCSYNKITIIKGFQSSNYTQHYKNKHPTIAYNKATEATKIKIKDISSKTDFFTNPNIDSRKRARNNTLTDFNDNEAYNKILNFIIENNLSFNILESATFKDLLSYYNRLTPIINRKKIKIILEKTYNTEYINLLNDLRLNIESNGTFSLIFDLWTSNNQNAYFGIILAYINTDFKLKYKLIGFEYLTESHTAEYIYVEFLRILTNYKFLNIISTSNTSILSITRDNASNNNKFISTLQAKNDTINDIRCSAHILNIIVQDILTDYILHSKTDYIIENNDSNESNINIKDIFITTKIRKLATLIKYTIENKKLLIEGIEKYKKEGLIPSNYKKTRIPLDNVTRWNSTYNMISTTLELKEPLIYINKITKNTEFKRYFLTDMEFDELYELKLIFEVFLKPTIKLQGQLYTTLNISLLYIYQIYNKLEALLNDYKSRKNIRYNSFIIAIKRGIEKLEKYFPRRITSLNIRSLKLYILALILDPRFKLIHFKNSGLLFHYSNIYNDAIGILRFEYIKIRNELKLKDTDNTNISFDELALEATINNDDDDDDDDDIFISRNINEEEEYMEYIKESIISNKDINPLDFWKQNTYRFPILSTLARRYLAIPVTSASIERVFSISNNIITKNRNRLFPDTVKQLILLKSWKLDNFIKLDAQNEEEDYTSQEED
jgi:hypothetical protein